jgi:hypothetical protein
MGVATALNHSIRSRLALLREERGAFLAEALIAVTVFTLLGTAVMTSVSASSSVAASIRTISTADTLASNHFHAILASPYQDPPFTFTTITPPAGFAITAEAQEYVVSDPNIARIVIVVSKGGSTVVTLESLRLKDSP